MRERTSVATIAFDGSPDESEGISRTTFAGTGSSDLFGHLIY